MLAKAGYSFVKKMFSKHGITLFTVIVLVCFQKNVKANNELRAVNAVIRYSNALIQSGFHIPLYLYYYDLEIQRYLNSDKTKSIGPYYFSHFYFNDSLEHFWQTYTTYEKFLPAHHKKQINAYLSQLKQNYLNQKELIAQLRQYIATQKYKDDHFNLYNTYKSNLLASADNINMIFGQLDYYLKYNYDVINALSRQTPVNKKLYSLLEQHRSDIQAFSLYLMFPDEKITDESKVVIARLETALNDNLNAILSLPNLNERVKNIITAYLPHTFDFSTIQAAKPIERMTHVWQQYNTCLRELNKEYEQIHENCAEYNCVLHLLRPVNMHLYNNQTPVLTVFIVDVTSSMRTDAKLETLTQALRELSFTSLNNFSLSLIQFTSKAEIVSEPVLPEQFRQINIPFAELSVASEASLSSGIQMAFRMAEMVKEEEHAIHFIIISDGVFLLKAEKFNFKEKLLNRNIKCSVLVLNENEQKYIPELSELTLNTKGEFIWTRKSTLASELSNLVYFQY